MTGYSHSWKYNKKLLGAVMFVSGIALILEHLFNFGGFDIELIGHEWYGLILIIMAFLLNMKWEQFPIFFAALKALDWRKILDEGER